MKHYKHKRVMTIGEYNGLAILLALKSGVTWERRPSIIKEIAYILDMALPEVHRTTKVVKKCRKKT